MNNSNSLLRKVVVVEWLFFAHTVVLLSMMAP